MRDEKKKLPSANAFRYMTNREQLFVLFTSHREPNVVRMERAVQAVAEGTASFAALSESLGFSAPAHFSRFFHDHAGSSPSTFRQVAAFRSSGPYSGDFETPR